jgi:hypothetical protein
MAPLISGLAASLVLLSAGVASAAASFKWTGGKQPGKLTTPKTGQVNIGEFINLDTPEDWGNVVFNVNNKFPGSKPWITWGVGAWPEHNAPLSDDKHEAYLTYFDGLGVEVYLEVRPGSANVVTLIDTYMKKFSKHPCIKGFGVDMEFYTWKGNKDDDAKAMDDKVKSFNPAYRMFFKHWEAGNMPKYRGKGDMIFFSTSSESAPANLIKGHADFCNTFAPNGVPTAACAFQIGYPADEPLGNNHVHNGPYDGWSAMKDPIKEWGDALLKQITSSTMELGMVWVTVKSERIPWDLTKGANIPTLVRATEPMHGRFLRVQRDGSRMTLKLADGAEIAVPAAADVAGRKIPLSGVSGPASGRYYLSAGGEAASWTEIRSGR